MIVVRYAVCSEREGKPTTRLVCDTRADADKAIEILRRQDAAYAQETYWVAELGPECDNWRQLYPSTVSSD